MTGSGTQNDPYIVTDWDELKTAAETTDAYVKLPANAEWDMNDQYPEDAPDIVLACTEIDGNGATIKNLRKSSGKMFSFNRYLNKTATVKNITFKSAYFTSAVMIYTVGNYSSAILKLENVIIGAELYDSTFMRCDTQKIIGDQCSLSVYISNCILFYGSPSFTNTTVNAEGTVVANINTLKLYSSAFYGDLRSYGSQYVFGFGGESCVIDCTLQNFSRLQYAGSATTILVNASKVGEVPIQGTVIQATTEQMRDAAWLNAAGFPCA